MELHHRKFDFRYLKKIVRIDDVLNAYGLREKLTQRGRYLWGPCPLHGGDNPTAFRVHRERHLWRCFSHCGGGDIVELVRRIESSTYAEAARILLRIATQSGDVTNSPSPPDSPFKGYRVEFRPFTYRIPLDAIHPFLQQTKGILSRTAQYFEAGHSDRSTLLQNTVAVRLYDILGNPLGYCGRRILPSEIQRYGKWRFPASFPKSETLYNAHRAISHRHSGIIIVECPWAAMRLTQAGFPSVVALLGTTVSPLQTAWLEKAPAVILLLDGDKAGRSCARRIAQILKNTTVVENIALPDGKEPEDLSDDELRSLIGSSLTFSLNQYRLGFGTCSWLPAIEVLPSFDRRR